MYRQSNSPGLSGSPRPGTFARNIFFNVQPSVLFFETSWFLPLTLSQALLSVSKYVFIHSLLLYLFVIAYPYNFFGSKSASDLDTFGMRVLQIYTSTESQIQSQNPFKLMKIRGNVDLPSIAVENSEHRTDISLCEQNNFKNLNQHENGSRICIGIKKIPICNTGIRIPGQFGCDQHRGGGSPSVCSRSPSAVEGGTGPSAALGLDSPVPCS